MTCVTEMSFAVESLLTGVALSLLRTRTASSSTRRLNAGHLRHPPWPRACGLRLLTSPPATAAMSANGTATQCAEDAETRARLSRNSVLRGIVISRAAEVEEEEDDANDQAEGYE